MMCNDLARAGVLFRFLSGPHFSDQSLQVPAINRIPTILSIFRKWISIVISQFADSVLLQNSGKLFQD